MSMFKRIFAGLLACGATLIFVTTLSHALFGSNDLDVVSNNSDSTTHSATESKEKANIPADYPVRLVIPSLGIDANVQYVGITRHGTMAVPTNFTDVGWYKNGPLPGSAGSAVMAGHVDNALALPGVFKHLEDIEIGADVYVLAKDGAKTHFVVENVQTYDASEAPASAIFAKKGEPRLNLITCQGDWIQSEHQYDRRLVVYTREAGVEESFQNGQI